MMDDNKNYSLEQTKNIELLIKKCQGTIDIINKFKKDCLDSSERVKSLYNNKILNVQYLDNDTEKLLKLGWLDRDNMKNQCITIVDKCVNLFYVFIRFYQNLKLENNQIINKIKKDFILTKKPPPDNAMPVWPSMISKSNKNVYLEKDEYIFPEYIDEYNILDNKKYAYKEYHEIKKILVNTFDNFKEIPNTYELDGYITPQKQYLFNIPKERRWLHNRYKKIMYRLMPVYKQNVGNIIVLQIFLKTETDNYILIDEFEPKNGKYYVYDSILEPIYLNGVMNKFRIKIIDNYI
jgi:hypothetical protein